MIQESGRVELRPLLIIIQRGPRLRENVNNRIILKEITSKERENRKRVDLWERNLKRVSHVIF